MAQRGLGPAQIAHDWDHGWVVGRFEKPDLERWSQRLHAARPGQPDYVPPKGSRRAD